LDHRETNISSVLHPFGEQGLPVGTTEYIATSQVIIRKYEDEEHPFGEGRTGSLSYSIR
jgi:hypothetical protein